VVATNISGGKTDGIVNQEIYHRAKIMDDGSIIDSLLISRNHFGPVDEDFTDVANRSYIRVYVPLGSELLSVNGFEYPDEKEFKEAGDYLEEDPRLLNERMAFIDTETKTKTYIENSKTVFGNWVTVQPGESKDVLLEYKLPFKLNFNEREQPQGILGKIKATFTSQEIYDSYSLLIQKQPGSNSDKIISKVEYPNTFNSQVVYPKEVSSFDGESVYNSVLAEDLFYFVGLKLKDN